MKPNPRLTPELRHFVELVLGGKTKTVAYAVAYGKEANRDSTRNAASRAWKLKAAVLYREELETRAKTGGNGGGAVAVIEHRDRLQEAADLSLQDCLRWCCQQLVFGPLDLIDQDPQSQNFGRPRLDRAHLAQSIRVASDGSITLTMPPKVAVLQAYVALKGFEPEKPVQEDDFYDKALAHPAMLPALREMVDRLEAGQGVQAVQDFRAAVDM